jgi:alpha-L-fucosidase
MNDSWGFNLTDHHYKSTRELIHYLVRAAGVGANLLLNIGPRPDGTIPPEAQTRLQEVGRWLASNGGAIYGTRAGPIPPRSWGVTTARGDTVYVHVLDWASTWPAGRVLQLTQLKDVLSIALPVDRESPDRIVALTRR